MLVYYLTGTMFALSNLVFRRVKIARFSDLNDPFELLAVDLSDRLHLDVFRKFKDQYNENKGLICFSKSWSNPLLWGHYADKHTGICLGFDVPDDHLLTVNYEKESMKNETDPQTNQTIITEKFFDKLQLTKFSDWKYEKEVRLIIDLNSSRFESGSYFCDFSDQLVLREIIIGIRCEIPFRGVQKLVSNFEPNPTILKSKLAKGSFKVVEQSAKNRE